MLPFGTAQQRLLLEHALHELIQAGQVGRRHVARVHREGVLVVL